MTPVGSVVPRFQYTGPAWLSEINLNHYKARFYTLKLGRFMQTDQCGTASVDNLLSGIETSQTWLDFLLVKIGRPHISFIPFREISGATQGLKLVSTNSTRTVSS